MAKLRLFVSYAAKDRKVAEATAELLREGLSLKSTEIACSSLEAEEMPEGVSLLEHVEGAIQGAEAVIVILSHNYYTSRFCLCELGIGWTLTRHVVPLVVPPLRRKHVSEIFSAKELRKIDDTDHLNRVLTDLQQDLGLANINLPRWAIEKKNFLAKLPALIEESREK